MTKKHLDDTQRGELIDALLGMRSVLVEPDVWIQNQLAARSCISSSGARLQGNGAHPLNNEADMFCLVGAACAVTRLPASNHPVARYLTGLLRRRYDWPGSVQQWNDCFGRTVEDVLGLIETALDELKAGGR